MKPALDSALKQTSKRILIIEDDVAIGNMLEEVLLSEGYAVSRAYSGTEALLLLSQRPAEAADLVLLDLMLPGLNGEELLPHLAGIPVIVLSAKADLDSKVSLLLGGAADYVTKPFQIRELLARISVQLRPAADSRASHAPSVPTDASVSVASSIPTASSVPVTSSAPPVSSTPAASSVPAASSAPSVSSATAVPLESSGLVFEDIYLDLNTRQVSLYGAQIHLTRTEAAILKLLMRHPAQVITKSLLLERISEDTPDCTDSSLKMHVSNLRKKLRDVSDWDYIEAVWGIGFKLRGKSGETASG